MLLKNSDRKLLEDLQWCACNMAHFGFPPTKVLDEIMKGQENSATNRSVFLLTPSHFAKQTAVSFFKFQPRTSGKRQRKMFQAQSAEDDRHNRWQHLSRTTTRELRRVKANRASNPCGFMQLREPKTACTVHDLYSLHISQTWRHLPKKTFLLRVSTHFTVQETPWWYATGYCKASLPFASEKLKMVNHAEQEHPSPTKSLHAHGRSNAVGQWCLLFWCVPWARCILQSSSLTCSHSGKDEPTIVAGAYKITGQGDLRRKKSNKGNLSLCCTFIKVLKFHFTPGNFFQKSWYKCPPRGTCQGHQMT